MHFGKRSTRYLSTSALVGVVAVSSLSIFEISAAQAQDQVETVIVTAQRRDENLQKVPVDVSVVSNEALADNASTNVLDLPALVPSVSFRQAIGFFEPQIRGVGS